MNEIPDKPRYTLGTKILAALVFGGTALVVIGIPLGILYILAHFIIKYW